MNVEASGFARLQVEASVVCAGDGLDDREAEAEAIVLASPVADQALERFEETASLAGGHDRSGVGYLKHGLIALVADRDDDGPPGVVVAQGVVEGGSTRAAR